MNDPNYGPSPETVTQHSAEMSHQVAEEGAQPSSTSSYGILKQTSDRLQANFLPTTHATVATPSTASASVSANALGDSALLSTSEDGVSQCIDGIGKDAQLDKITSICTFCNSGAKEAFTSTQLRHSGIWLHAYKYEGKGWSHSVPLPPWTRLK